MMLFAALLLSTSAHAIPESQFSQVKELLENRDKQYLVGKFNGVDNAQVGYVKYGEQPGAKGCLVISPGQGEASLKYMEVMYDLSQKGFSPIYSIDHRGQGLSSRLLPDPQKSHVEKFSDYVDDFSTFVDKVVLANPACQGHTVNLLAHSMGGAIASLYLEKVGSSSPFQKAVLSAPMLKIKYPAGKTEDSVIRETWFACNTPFGPGCKDFVPGKGPYNPNTPFDDTALTHSAVRFELKKIVFTKWPESQVGGPTVSWVRQSALADKELRQKSNTARIATPILVLQAEQDQLVDNAGQDEFCAITKDCRLEKIPGAKHELLMEVDSIRDSALEKILAQFQ